MRIYDAFFFGTLFFLAGVFAGSLSTGQADMGLQNDVWWVIAGGIAAVFLLRYAQGREWKFNRWGRSGWLVMAALLFFIPAGGFYYTVDDARFLYTPLPEGERAFTAEIVSHPVTEEGTQGAVLKLMDNGLRVRAKFPAYPEFSYGDTLTFTGRIEVPFSDSYRAYLAKERVRGVVAFPKIVSHESGRVSFRGALYTLRERIVDSFRRTLPAKEAALMAGITVGAREDFSESFRDAMAQSGTTHLVALSGYNISIVVMVAMALFLAIFPRRVAFFVTLAVVISFVLMTGAEASVVRAAVMGGVMLLARHMGRRFDVRNAILFAALVMVLINPKVLMFDLGFQLSFLALLGIVYVKPALDRFLGWEGTKGILSWRENLTTTASAQLAVAPLLISTFGNVSLSSLAANILVLEIVPFTMGIGFVLAAASFASFMLAQFMAFFALALLKFQTLVIEFFAVVSFPVSPIFSLGTVGLYYGALLIFIYYVRHNHFVSRRV